MLPNEGPVGTSQEWLRRAKSNLARAKQPKPDEAVWEDLCFDAQQAAEKALKAVLIFRSIDFPRTHNIRVLLSLLAPPGQLIPQELSGAIGLTTYATVSRYPGAAEPVTEDE
ncbi:MAG: HEPN domain-containing protein [Acidobacteria bacterium]|nr:HEPN domain-containing protein [Acidobacteriota bacterium]